MNHNDNAATLKGQRDKNSILSRCSESIEVAIANPAIDRLRFLLRPVFQADRRFLVFNRQLRCEL